MFCKNRGMDPSSKVKSVNVLMQNIINHLPISFDVFVQIVLNVLASRHTGAGVFGPISIGEGCNKIAVVS